MFILLRNRMALGAFFPCFEICCHVYHLLFETIWLFRSSISFCMASVSSLCSVCVMGYPVVGKFFSWLATIFPSLPRCILSILSSLCFCFPSWLDSLSLSKGRLDINSRFVNFVHCIFWQSSGRCHGFYLRYRFLSFNTWSWWCSSDARFLASCLSLSRFALSFPCSTLSDCFVSGVFQFVVCLAGINGFILFSFSIPYLLQLSSALQQLQEVGTHVSNLGKTPLGIIRISCLSYCPTSTCPAVGDSLIPFVPDLVSRISQAITFHTVRGGAKAKWQWMLRQDKESLRVTKRQRHQTERKEKLSSFLFFHSFLELWPIFWLSFHLGYFLGCSIVCAGRGIEYSAVCIYPQVQLRKKAGPSFSSFCWCESWSWRFFCGFELSSSR